MIKVKLEDRATHLYWKLQADIYIYIFYLNI